MWRTSNVNFILYVWSQLLHAYLNCCVPLIESKNVWHLYYIFDLNCYMLDMIYCIFILYSCLTSVIISLTSIVTCFIYFFFHMQIIYCITSHVACLTWIIAYLEYSQKKMKLFLLISCLTSMLHIWHRLSHVSKAIVKLSYENYL